MEILLILLGFLLLEMPSIRISVDIKEAIVTDSFLQFYKKGYKIKKESLLKYKKRIDESAISKYIYLINMVILFIPCINIIYTLIKDNINRLFILHDKDIIDGLEPMTEIEKEEFSKMKTRDEKMVYLSFMYQKDNKRIYEKDDSIINIGCDRLLPLAYTYEEIQMLNDVSGGLSIKGRIDGCNIAVVGVPDNKKKYKKIFFSKANKEALSFIEYSEEEAKNKTYIVYPFTVESEKLIQNEIDKIVENRLNREKTIPYSHIDTFEEKGPVLRHTLYKR